MPDLADILAGRGSALLGAGGFSIVVADPECPRTAIKIGPSLSDAWPAWAAFAVDHPGPHVPVVHSLRWIWSRSGAPLFYVAEVERLRPTDAARAWLEACPEGRAHALRARRLPRQSPSGESPPCCAPRAAPSRPAPSTWARTTGWRGPTARSCCRTRSPGAPASALSPTSQSEDPMPLITRADLARVAPHAAADIVGPVVDHADDVLPRYGLATAERLPDFLAHVLVESAYGTTCAENLNYSADRLHVVWPSHFPTVASAEPFAHNAEALADKVYGGRMGNTGPNDGWLFRGQGLLQITGRDNFARLAAKLGKTVRGDARLPH